MAPDPVTVGAETPLPEIARLMADHRLEAVGVVDAEGRLLGAVVVHDLVARAASPAYLLEELSSEDAYEVMAEHRAHSALLAAARASDIMRARVPTVGPDAPLPEIASRMADADFLPVLVVEQDRLLGVISSLDVCRALANLGAQLPAEESSP